MTFIKRNQKGFTLIELVIAIPIIAIVGLAASAALIQVIQSTQTSAHMTALRQVQTAGYWVSRDALQAQEEPDVTPPTGFLSLTWTDSEDDEVHQVIYSLPDMPSGTLKKFQRQEIVTDGGAPVSDTTTLVSQYIDSSQTSCTWDEDTKMLTFTVTATMEGEIETRTYEVQPRPLS